MKTVLTYDEKNRLQQTGLLHEKRGFSRVRHRMTNFYNCGQDYEKAALCF